MVSSVLGLVSCIYSLYLEQLISKNRLRGHQDTIPSSYSCAEVFLGDAHRRARGSSLQIKKTLPGFGVLVSYRR